MNRKRKGLITGFAVAALLAVILWIAWGNSTLMVHEINITDSKIPEPFSGFRIVQVSDLHNAEFGDGNQELLTMLKSTNPDIIVLTGDLVDSSRTDIEVSLAFARQAVRIAPTYYVTGNHEARIFDYKQLKKGLEAAGILVLGNETVKLEKDGEYIILAGVDDPSFQRGERIDVSDFGTDEPMDDTAIMESVLKGIIIEHETYTVLLSHRPELFDTYVESGVDLVMTGHAHGGQFRLPVIGGVVAPGQGLFPKYDAGLYTEGSTNMVVSRGLGNSVIPFRINNRPEIVVVELKADKS